MKQITIGLLGVLMFGLGAVASDQSAVLESLNRVIRFNLVGDAAEFGYSPKDATGEVTQELSLYFAKIVGESAYYVGNIHNTSGFEWNWEPLVYAKITPTPSGAVKVVIVRAETERYIEALVGNPSRSGKLLSENGDAELEDFVEGDPDYYFVNFERGKLGKNWIKVSLQRPLLASHNYYKAGLPLPQTGRVDFRLCDGCEHSDQFMVLGKDGKLDVNAIEILPRSYYEGDCPGELHRLLEQMVELGVPFKFYGNVTALTHDLWEGGFWTATDGKLYVGNSEDYELEKFLDELPSLITSDKSRYPEIWSEGSFIDYEDNMLIFQFENDVVRIDL
jgi:hypothetical protein